MIGTREEITSFDINAATSGRMPGQLTCEAQLGKDYLGVGVGVGLGAGVCV